MRATVQRGLESLLFALVALPVAALLTISLTPFWGWLESKSGIESLGHSGPSDWCFYVVYGTLLSAGAGLAWQRSRRP